MSVIEIDHLRKAYGSVVAVDDVSLAVERGEVFGVLGPNGAGKTTLVECATGLRTPDAGTVRVLGLDPLSDRGAVRERVGVQLQSSALPAKIRVREALALYASFYARTADVAELIAALDLEDTLDRYFGRLSGGQKQRLAIGRAFLKNPSILLLDEPTSALDAKSEQHVKDALNRLLKGRTSVIVAHRLSTVVDSDRIVVMDKGRILAVGNHETLQHDCPLYEGLCRAQGLV